MAFQNNRTSHCSVDSLIADQYRPLFEEIERFNEMQSLLFNDCVSSDDSMVVMAPTGSGKTIIFLLAIMRELIKVNWPETEDAIRMIYVAPTRALCAETFEKWEEKFSRLNIRCREVTGDTNVTDLGELERYHIVLTTPEKWDSLTRRWGENIIFLSSVKLVMIDEIHLLNEARRGAALEATICRIQIGARKSGSAVRLIGISATLANVEDVTKWFGENTKAYTISTGSHAVTEKIVAVPLNEEESFFKVDAIMNSWLPGIVSRHWQNRPTLIFCITRMSAEGAAKALVKNFSVELKESQQSLLESITENIDNKELKESLKRGIAFHHGGLTLEDRLIVEHLFRSENLPILVSTQTLAMGVNFPAHLVIVKAPNPIPATEMLQMLGRAGRVGLTSDGGVAVILTRTCHAMMYQNLRDKISPIESNLHENLEEYMNSEVFTGNIVDEETAIEWIKSSFLYVRLHINPTHYGFKEDTVENQLTDLCQRTIKSLKVRRLVCEENHLQIISTVYGSLVARYFLHLDTIKMFQEEISGREKIIHLFNIVCKCSEFQQFTLRVTDKRILNEWNESHNIAAQDDKYPTGRSQQSLRFPILGKINSITGKVSCVLQAILGNFNVKDTHLRDESDKMIKMANHLTKCLLEVLKIVPGDKFSALLSALILCKCFTAELWEDSPFVCRQLPQIDEIMAHKLADKGLNSFHALRKANFRSINEFLPESPEIGRSVVESVCKIPLYSVKHCWMNGGTISLKVQQNNVNYENERDPVALIVGDEKINSLLFFTENVFENGNNYEAMVVIDIKYTSIQIHLIHLSLVGVDVHLTLDPKERHLINILKMEKRLPAFEDSEDIEMRPPSPKAPKLENVERKPNDLKEVEMMELYRKSVNQEEIENQKESFDLGIDYFFKQLESKSKENNQETVVNLEATKDSNVKDFKTLYEREMSKILRKPYHIPPTRNLQDEYQREVKRILEDNDLQD